MSDIDIKTEYSPQYRRVNVAGIFGGIVAGGVEAVVYSEERRVDRALEVAQTINEPYVHEKNCRTGPDYRPYQYEGDL